MILELYFISGILYPVKLAEMESVPIKALMVTSIILGVEFLHLL